MNQLFCKEPDRQKNQHYLHLEQLLPINHHQPEPINLFQIESNPAVKVDSYYLALSKHLNEPSSHLR